MHHIGKQLDDETDKVESVPLLSEHNYTSSDMTSAEAKTYKDWSKYTPDMLRKEISSPLKKGEN